MFEHNIVQSASKTSYNSLSNIKSFWNERNLMSKNHHAYFSTCLKMSEFCGSVKLKAHKLNIFLSYIQHFTLFNNFRFIRMLVIVAECSGKRSEDFMTSSDVCHSFHTFADLRSFSLKTQLIWKQKYRPRTPYYCIFFWSWRSESFDKINFF